MPLPFRFRGRRRDARVQADPGLAAGIDPSCDSEEPPANMRDGTDDYKGLWEPVTSADSSWPRIGHFIDRVVLRTPQSTYIELLDILSGRESEFAAMLMGPKADPTLVTHAVFDERGIGTATSFALDPAFLNKKLRLYRHVAMECKGFAHSQPPDFASLSSGDLLYVRRLFRNPKNQGTQFIYMPVVCGGQLYPWIVARDGAVGMAQVILV